MKKIITWNINSYKFCSTTKAVILLTCFYLVFLAYCLEQNDLDYIGENLKVRFAVIDNFIVNEQDLPRFEARISLTNDGDSPINEVDKSLTNTEESHLIFFNNLKKKSHRLRSVKYSILKGLENNKKKSIADLHW